MHIAMEWIRKWRECTRGGIKLLFVDSNQGRTEKIRMDETGSWLAARIGRTWGLPKMALK